MKRNVWLTVHGEQQYEGMSADSSDLRVRGTMEETRDGYLLRYEETDGDGKVTTATRLALAPDCIILTRTGEVTSEMVFAEGKEHTSFYAVPYGTLPVAVMRSRSSGSSTRTAGCWPCAMQLLSAGREENAPCASA